MFKPGREDEFTQTWGELVEWSECRGAGTALLLRDREGPNPFFSFGPWDSVEQIEAWRANPGFEERVGTLRELLESFEPRTLDVAAAVGDVL